MREGDKVTVKLAAMSLFRVGGDGKLDFARQYGVETGPGQTQY